MSYLFINGAAKMIDKHKPYIQSTSVNAKELQKYKISDLNNVHFAILDHKD